jgi:LuxR family maltose regulon positive regulatory protein
MEEAATQVLAEGRRYIIKRPRLTRLLDESKARILMLVAPAGYGKTTLAREWLENREHGWYRGVPASADVAALAVGLAEAAGTVVPGAGRRMRERLRVTANPERDVQPLAELLAEDLTEWPDTAWLAIDDYHFTADSEASERFVDLLTSHSPVRLLLASRKRPRWATSRRILYGEIHELGAHELAMTRDEARAVLADRRDDAAGGLVVLTAGWPAVIGLAALTESNLCADDLPNGLYDYFAEELYQAASPEVQEGLCQLSLALSITAELARSLFDSGATAILKAGVDLGFLVRPSRDAYELHPLLQKFLESKLNEQPERAVAQLVHNLGQFFISHELWDDLFVLAKRSESGPLFFDLLGAALPHLVREGRISTIAQWIAFAHAQRLDSPLVDLAEAEVALCEGNAATVEVLAQRAASHLNQNHSLASRASWLAGMGAHMLDRSTDAIGRQRVARALAVDEDSRLRALWGEISSSLNGECGDIATLLAELAQHERHSVEIQLRLATGRLLWALQSGRLTSELEHAEAALPLLERSHDPLARTALLNHWSNFLTLAGRYAEGCAAAMRQLQEARDYRLDFVVPHACLNQATAELGLRRVANADALIRRAVSSANRANRFIALHAATLMIRLKLAQGDLSSALAITRPSVPQSTPGIEGEFRAARSLALVCANEFDEAIAHADAAYQLTIRPEARVLAECTRAVADLRRETPDAGDSARRSFYAALVTGVVDPFVTAYRVWPGLLEAVANIDLPSAERASLEDIVQAAGDHHLNRRLGISRPASRRSHHRLTRRELEVLELIAAGRTNRDIAKTLFITEKTVKVHARHIFEKLGVKSRTEAALRVAAERSSSDVGEAAQS